MKLFENKNQYRQSYQQEKHSRCAEYLLKVGIPSPRRSVEPAVFPRLQHAFPPELFASQQIFGIRKPFSRIRVAVSFYFVPLDEHHVVIVWVVIALIFYRSKNYFDKIALRKERRTSSEKVSKKPA